MSFSRFKRRLIRALPPIPHVWSPGKIWRWIRARPRRFRNFKRLASLAGVALIGLAVARPVSHAIKAWQARRLAHEASEFLEKEDWKNAGRKLQDAFRVWFNEPEVWRVEARFLARIGQNQEAQRWWQRVSDSQALSIADRRDYAATALAVRDLTVAEEQVNQLLAANPHPAAPDLVLAGALASMRNNTTRALEYGNQVLADPTAAGKEKIAAAGLILSNTTPDSQSYRQAYEKLVSMARGGDEDVTALQALTILARQAPPKQSARGPSEDHRPATDTTTMLPAEIAERLERHHKARSFHRMLALEVRTQIDPENASDLVKQAVKKFGNGDDETVAMLAAWLYTRREYEMALKILPIERATRNRDLFIQRVDALAALGRYSEMEEMLLSEQSVVDPAMQHMFLAVVRSKLGESVASDNEWERALDEADSLAKLLGLADFAEKNGALTTADAAYARAIAKEPGLRAAYHARLRLAEALGQTPKAHKIAKEIVRLWPDDTPTKVREIYLRLLLDTSAETSRTAEKEIAAIMAKNPWDTAAATTLALARLRQGHIAAALEAAPQPGPGVPPSAPLAVAWAANGWKDRARDELNKLATAKLLPEERALISGLDVSSER